MKFAKFLMYLSFFTYPYYVFPSGGFQPALGLLLLAAFVLAVTNPSKIILTKTSFALIIFTVYAGIVNSIWYFKTYDISYISFVIITFFGCFAFLTINNIIGAFTKKDATVFLFVIFATLVTQVVLLSLGIVRDPDSVRTIIWFNNPNQLGYFCVLSAGIAITTGYVYRIQSWLIPVILGMCIFLTAFSLSRAALGGCLMYIPIILFFSKTVSIPKKLILMLLIIIAGVFAWDQFTHSETYTQFERRVEKGQEKNKTTSEERHFDRVLDEPDYLAFGAGKGGYDRYDVSQEIHNLLLSVLFSYGVVGLLLYLNFLIRAIPNFAVWIYLTPVVVYNLTHNGGRVLAFWFLLSICASPAARYLKAKKRRANVKTKKITHRSSTA